jgi:hypothetical protein
MSFLPVRIAGSISADFIRRCNGFAARHPRYQDVTGHVAMGHVVLAIRAEGFAEVRPDNLDAIMSAIEARAIRKESVTA